jgi:hypothetical protein
MKIRFTSSLTADDENRMVELLLDRAAALLDRLPIAYSLHIETTGGKVFDRTHFPDKESRPEDDATAPGTAIVPDRRS